ncbi:hypothetical protein Tco_0252710 [Tanacetum coccineum]
MHILVPTYGGMVNYVGNKERTYSLSITKAPATRYTIEGIEDMIPTLWSPVVEKKQGYGYLKEIVVRRADQNLYKFKEGDFPDLHLNDIEDILLIIAQNKLSNLDGDVIVDFVTALKLFTRGIILKNKTLLHRLKNFRLGYNQNSDMPRREWTEKDKKCTGYILRKIDDQLLKRKIMRSLEMLVGGSTIETDKQLLQRTI